MRFRCWTLFPLPMYKSTKHARVSSLLMSLHILPETAFNTLVCMDNVPVCVFVSSFCIIVCVLDVVAWMRPSSRLVICIPLLCLRGSSSHWFPSAFVNSLLRAINCAIFLKLSSAGLPVSSCALWGKNSATLRSFEAQFQIHTNLDIYGCMKRIGKGFLLVCNLVSDNRVACYLLVC